MSIEFYVEKVRESLEYDEFEKRKILLDNIRKKIIREIEETQEGKYVLLLLTVELELRLEIERISLEQNTYYDRFNDVWSDEEKDLWKINYAVFLYEEKGEEKEAVSLLLSISSPKQYIEKYYLLAQIFFFKGDYINAEKNYLKVKSIGINSGKLRKILLGLGTCFIYNRKYKEAIKVLERISDNWNNEVAIKANIHLLKAYLKKGKIIKAKRLYYKIKNHRSEIDENFYYEYLSEVIRNAKNMEIAPVCPYIYCARHMM